MIYVNKKTSELIWVTYLDDKSVGYEAEELECARKVFREFGASRKWLEDNYVFVGGYW